MTKDQIKLLEETLGQAGFTRISDYYDMGACAPPLNGSILQFFNPKTMEGMQVSIGAYDDESMFGEDFREECDELMGETPRDPLRVTSVEKTYYELLKDPSEEPDGEPFEADDLEDAQARVLEVFGYVVRECPKKEIP